LEWGWLGETEGDLVSGELMVAVHNGIELVLHNFLVHWVEENLLVLLSINGDSDGSSGNLGWENLF